MTIRGWLAGIGLEELASVFERERIDLTAARHLTDVNLKDLGLPMGDRLKLLAAVAALAKDEMVPHADTTNVPATDSRNVSVERRQLTVLFCDLVASTAFAHTMDPEQLRELMRAYQQACRDVIDKYDGHVAQYLGDGLMTYFGWPRAHEDDAERAVRTSLEIIEAVKRVSAPSPLQVRIGIATGPVVVGDTGAGDASVPKLAVGETPNFAARLQAQAGPDEIVVAPSTHQLAGAVFHYVDLGQRMLKGLTSPVQVWRVTGISQVGDRFEARSAQLGALVGREDEKAILFRRWGRAQDGEGQVVLIRGEPGIGKSRLTRALDDQIGSKAHYRLRY